MLGPIIFAYTSFMSRDIAVNWFNKSIFQFRKFVRKANGTLKTRFNVFFIFYSIIFMSRDIAVYWFNWPIIQFRNWSQKIKHSLIHAPHGLFSLSLSLWLYAVGIFNLSFRGFALKDIVVSLSNVSWNRSFMQ